ncbi:MAG: hypothetical protein WC821_04315 [archaeon]
MKIFILIFILVLLIGCTQTDTKDKFEQFNSTLEKFPPNLARELGKLEPLNIESVDSFEKFSEMCESMNIAVKLLNREGGFEFEEIKVTSENYEKLAKIVTKYGPLIDNYNLLINSARQFEEGNPEKETAFYVSAGSFGLEVTLIVGLTYYRTAFELTGFLYRTSRLNKLAFACPTCVETILSKVHWFVRTTLIEETSNLVTSVLNNPEKIISESQNNFGNAWNSLLQNIDLNKMVKVK